MNNSKRLPGVQVPDSTSLKAFSPEDKQRIIKTFNALTFNAMLISGPNASKSTRMKLFGQLSHEAIFELIENITRSSVISLERIFPIINHLPNLYKAINPTFCV